MTVKAQDYRRMTQPERSALRSLYVESQGGLCQHCGGPLKGEPTDRVKRASINWRLFPKNFTKHPVHLHHCHKTGLTIGAVHALCNAYLWQYHGE